MDEHSGAYRVGKLYAAICDAMNVGKTNAKTKPQTTEQSQNPTVGGDAHIAPQNTDTKTSESDYAAIIANAETTLPDVGDGSPVPTQSANFSSPTVEELTEIFKNGMKRAGYVPSQTPAPTTTPIDHKTDTSSTAIKTVTTEPTVKELTKLFIDGATRSGYVPAETTATTVDESQADSSKDDIDNPKTQEYNNERTSFWGSNESEHGHSGVIKEQVVTSQQRATVDSFKHSVTTIRASLKSKLKKSGNIAFAQVDISGVPVELKAFSRVNKETDVGVEIGFVLKTSNPIFSTFEIDGFDRSCDTEAKILERIASILGLNSSIQGKITLFTERTPCESCMGVLKQFKDRYSNIHITVYDSLYNVWYF